ncbi:MULTISPECIES: S6 family peptidase [Enterobacteriaceae]|uniref:S6 family peptidase n=1 Tax=Enterobacteriaceae TaxID=543 RepID=UPI000461D4A8|nr:MULTISPECIES: S6 family peptidase [Enterobacteriaceae]EKV4339391.1 autotransporter outer membrane beta-barrel domain-containing protein [Klebsiella pneumoniae]KAA5682143.1 autotransporter outer membrane beta-barrel domain-containing protein [Klebsiella pneumoniae]KAA5689885.1 autotransporter outer membrane beta-barrel domain-containing protein [Klebsiella pneumoniae]KAA5703025.1 autotransporter outer membrane beta-barrel domain-containing protein [Klebsiella pneumoniae]KAA5711076.1 autotran
MNKIYFHKYCHITHSVKVVSELAKKRSRGRRKLSTLLLLNIVTFIPAISSASVVGNDVSYQTYRDFAENKGQFSVGAERIHVFNKQGKSFSLLNAGPMPDFSASDIYGISTLVNPQYISSVKHNGSYTNVSFGNGENKYNIVNRNNHPSQDFHLPRLDKLVTEVIPTAVTKEGQAPYAYAAFMGRYTAFYRLGSGTQYVKDRNNNIHLISNPYRYLIGGTVAQPYSSNMIIASNPGNVFAEVNGPLSSYGAPGDSGSPLFAYDSLEKKWVMVGVLDTWSGEKGTNSVWEVLPLEFLEHTMSKDNDSPVKFNASTDKSLAWSFNRGTGIGVLKQGNITYAMHGQRNHDLDAGKNLLFTGKNGDIDLLDDVYQGAGSLTFKDDYTVHSSKDKIWSGSGVIIDKGVTVNWQVNGVKGDNLHKLGEGTLLVSAKGVNEGGLKVGDGITILNQKADERGNIQAFSSVNIASGRPSVILGDNKQINPDNIAWGYRGGVLDINGNDLIFHQLKAADYGAILANNSADFATVTLDYSLKPNDIELESWAESRNGTIGNLYKYNNPYTHTTDFFILNKNRYGYFPANQSSTDVWKYVGHNQSDAQKLAADHINAAGYVFHGQLKGNLNVENHLPRGSSGALVMDGSADTNGSFTQENGRLTMQGHPVIHAYNEQWVADKIAQLGDHSVLTQPTSFQQDDWENRTFAFRSLVLKNADFGLGRNATLTTNIIANNSKVTLGDKRVFIDKKDGAGTNFKLEEGESTPQKASDKSLFKGGVKLENNSVLNINGAFRGGIQANGSTVNISSNDAILGDSSLSDTSVNLVKGANILATKGISSNSVINISDAIFNINGRADETSHALHPVYNSASSWNLNGDNARLNVGPYSILSGDITAHGAGVVSIGGGGELSPDLTPEENILLSVFNGYKNTWEGALNAANAQISMTDTLWAMDGNSKAGKLKLNRALVGFNDSTSHFVTLTTDNLDSTESAFVMRTDFKNSDKLVINKMATGDNNKILMNFLKKTPDSSLFDIPIVIAPKGTSDSLFTASTQTVGFSDITPNINIRENNGHKEWILNGYKSTQNKQRSNAAATFMHINYNSFITEINNMNKRLGDLRGINDNTGSWVRLLSGSGSGAEGLKDNYTLLQMGVDSRHELNNMNLFTGLMTTYTNTDISTSTALYSGNTKSWGFGVYASGLFPSGGYFDLIAKYIYNKNNYRLDFLGAGIQKFHSHTLYAGTEVGYRYRLTDSIFMEPQAELVFGGEPGHSFNWSDKGMDVSMQRDKSNLLIGRTGIVSGKTFLGKGWSMTTKLGLNYEFDITKSADTYLMDAAGKHQIDGKKDGRMLFSVGANVNLGDNTRLGLETERSAFGRYNTDSMINANLRYSF